MQGGSKSVAVTCATDFSNAPPLAASIAITSSFVWTTPAGFMRIAPLHFAVPGDPQPETAHSWTEASLAAAEMLINPPMEFPPMTNVSQFCETISLKL